MSRFNTIDVPTVDTTVQHGNITAASRQWFSRPDDQRYVSLEDLADAVQRRRAESWTATPQTREIQIRPDEQTNDLGALVYDPGAGETRNLGLSNWSFNQLSTYAQAPAKYLRSLPAPLAAINLQYGLDANPVRNDALILGQSNGTHELRSMTSTSYGRIWDADVVAAVQAVNEDGRWQIPASTRYADNPRRATTLYASDRDVFIFLVDPDHPIEIPGQHKPSFRGFFTWNSEVGAATFGLCAFLYEYVCDNRIIWGASNVQEVRIRHTGGAPDRFRNEGRNFLHRYANESTTQLLEGIKAAQTHEIPLNIGKSSRAEEFTGWMQKRGFTKTEAKGALESARQEDGREPRTWWDAVQAVTAYARTVPHTDRRVDLETRAGRMMDLAARAA